MDRSGRPIVSIRETFSNRYTAISIPRNPKQIKPQTNF
jgi:hypothetical protein